MGDGKGTAQAQGAPVSITLRGTMRVRFTEPVFNDLDSIRGFIGLDNPAATAEVVAKLVQASQRLEGLPSLGRAGRVVDTRELIVPPYVVVYTTIADTIWILRVLHGARKWP